MGTRTASRPASRRRGAGLFVTFEGVEGSGKTTQIRRLARRLRREGLDPLVTREPGGTALADGLRAFLLDPRSAGMPPLAELFLYAAGRADHLERRILPALRAGRVVLCDRFLDATLAYQGHGRGLSLAFIRRIHSLPPLDTRPDLTLLLDLPVAEGLGRAVRRIASARGDREGRIEAESLDFHRRVAAGYRSLARSSPRHRIVVASGSVSEVEKRIARIVLPLALARATNRSSRSRPQRAESRRAARRASRG